MSAFATHLRRAAKRAFREPVGDDGAAAMVGLCPHECLAIALALEGKDEEIARLMAEAKTEPTTPDKEDSR